MVSTVLGASFYGELRWRMDGSKYGMNIAL